MGGEGELAVPDKESCHSIHGAHEDGSHRGQNQCQLSVFDHPEHVGRAEGGQHREGQRDLLGEALLDHIGVGCNAGGDLAGPAMVEVGCVLPQHRLEISFPDLAGDALTRICEADGGDVDGDDCEDNSASVFRTCCCCSISWNRGTKQH